jgi:histidyl-tRNA synthetase
VILGSDEMAKGVATLKTLKTGAQEEVKLTDLAQRLRT